MSQHCVKPLNRFSACRSTVHLHSTHSAKNKTFKSAVRKSSQNWTRQDWKKYAAISNKTSFFFFFWGWICRVRTLHQQHQFTNSICLVSTAFGCQWCWSAAGYVFETFSLAFMPQIHTHLGYSADHVHLFTAQTHHRLRLMVNLNNKEMSGPVCQVLDSGHFTQTHLNNENKITK